MIGGLALLVSVAVMLPIPRGGYWEEFFKLGLTILSFGLMRKIPLVIRDRRIAKGWVIK